MAGSEGSNQDRGACVRACVAWLRLFAEARSFGLARDEGRRCAVRHGYLLALEDVETYTHRAEEPSADGAAP